MDRRGGEEPVPHRRPGVQRLQDAVRDRAGQFTASFDEIFDTEGIRVARTPPRTPVANCYIERWIGSLRRELLDRTIIWNENQLRRLVVGYLELRITTSTARTAHSASSRRP